MNKSVENNRIALSVKVINKETLAPDDSVFELVIVASQRCKQLTSGARPRITNDTWKRKNTSIALEEVRYKFVPFATAADTDTPSKHDIAF